jgi:hypothetical protein
MGALPEDALTGALGDVPGHLRQGGSGSRISRSFDKRGRPMWLQRPARYGPCLQTSPPSPWRVWVPSNENRRQRYPSGVKNRTRLAVLEARTPRHDPQAAAIDLTDRHRDPARNVEL